MLLKIEDLRMPKKGQDKQRVTSVKTIFTTNFEDPSSESDWTSASSESSDQSAGCELLRPEFTSWEPSALTPKKGKGVQEAFVASPTENMAN